MGLPLTEITCHARGVLERDPDVVGVVDGQGYPPGARRAGGFRP
jgi:hypothetical protein